MWRKNAKTQRELIGKLFSLNVGMSCTVETFYGQYIASSLPPLSTNSLCYGSNTAGVHVAKSDNTIERLLSVVAALLNVKKHMVTQVCDEQQVEVALPFNVQVHKYSLGNAQRSYIVHMPLHFWVRYSSSTFLRPELMTAHASTEPEPAFEKLTWKNPIPCNECARYIDGYEYYSYEKFSFGDRRGASFEYACCLPCYTRLLPSRNFKVPFSRIVRKTLPLSERLVYWKNSDTGEICFRPPNRKIPLNPDAFDSLAVSDPNNERDQATLNLLFTRVSNGLVEDLVKELNGTQDYMLVDAEHLAQLAHSKGINLRHLGRLTYQASCNYVKEIALILVISRGIKNLVREALAGIELSQDPRDVVVSYLNHLLSVAETTVSRKVWEQLGEHVQTHWAVRVEKSALGKVHMPSLAIAVCRQLRVAFRSFFDVNYLSLVPFQKDNIVLIPTVLDEAYIARSVDLLLAMGHTLDQKGRRGKWNDKGGPERQQATEYFDRAVRTAAGIYQKDMVQYADTAFEYAAHLESLHEEKGNPLNSKWNRSALVPPSKHSELAIFFFQEALKVYETEQFGYKRMIECLLGLAKLNETQAVSFSKP